MSFADLVKKANDTKEAKKTSSFSELVKKANSGTTNVGNKFDSAGVNSWFQSVGSVSKKAYDYLSADGYKKADEGLLASIDEYLSSADDIRQYLVSNKAYFSDYDKVYGDYFNATRTLQSLRDQLQKSNSIYSKYESEDAYNKAMMGWLDESSASTPEQVAARQAQYKSNQDRVSQIEDELPWYAKTWLPNFVEDIFLSDENEAKRDEAERLEAENTQYERLQGKTDKHYMEETPEFLKWSSNRNFTNATKEDLRYHDSQFLDYETKWSNYSMAGSMGEDGAILDPTGKVVYAANDYSKAYMEGTKDSFYNAVVQDKLGMFLAATDEDYDDAFATVTGGNSNDTWANLILEGENNAWKQLTEHEINTYYYYLNTQGQAVAYQYLEDMTVTLTKRATMARAEEYDNASVLEQIALNIASIPMNVFGGAIGLLGDAGNAIQGNEYNPYASYHSWTNDASAIRYNTAMDINNATGNAALPVLGFTFGDVYQSLMSGADSLVGAALGGSSYGALMGMGAATSTMKDMYEKGATMEQMVAGGILSGAAEMVFEKYSIDKLVTMGDSKTIKGVIINTLKQGGIEASEEMFTEIANTISNYVIMGSQSDWVDAATFAKNVVNAGLGGFISSGVSAGLINTANYAKYNQNMTQQGAEILARDGADPLKQLALEMAAAENGLNAKSLTKAANKVTDAVSKKNANKLGRLSDLMGETVSAQDVSDVKSALVEKGISEKDAKRYAEYLVNENKLDEKDIKKIEAEIKNNDKVKAVVKEVLDNPTSAAAERQTKLLAARLGIRTTTPTATLTGEKTTSGSIALRNEVDVKDKVSESNETIQISSGEAIKIDKSNAIAKTKVVDGERVVFYNTDRGVVEASDIAYASEEEGLIFESFVDMSPAFANAIIKNYDGTVPVQTYIKGMREGVVLYGMHNFQAVGKDISKSSTLAELSEADQAFALNLGRAYAKANAKKGSNAIKTAIKHAEERANAAGEDTSTKNTKGGRVSFETGTKATTKSQRRAVQLAKILSKAIGIDIVFYDARTTTDKRGKKANGFFDPKTNRIHLDLQNADSDTKTIAFTLSHELVHFIKKWSPAKFNTFANFLMKQYAEHGISTEQLLANKMAELETTNADLAYEELVADACERMLLDSNAVVKLAQLRQTDVGLFNKIKAHILDILRKIRGEYEARNIDTTTDEGQALHSMKDVMEQMYSLFEDAAVDAAQTFQTAKSLNVESMIVTEEGTIQLQMKQYQQTGRSTLLNYLREQYGDNNANDLIATIDNIYNVMAEIKEDTALTVFGNWQDTEVELDAEGRPIFTTSINNGDYELNQDFSRVCKKRRQLNFVLNMLAEDPAFEASNLTKQDFVKINKAIKEHGFEIACALCFVDSKRFRQSEWADSFANTWNDILGSIKADDKPLSRFNFATKSVNMADDGIQIDETKPISYRKWENGKVKETRQFKNIHDLLANDGNNNVRAMARLLLENPNLRHEFRGADIIASNGFDMIQRLAPDVRGILDGWGGSSVPKPSSNDAIYDNSVLNIAGYNAKKAFAVGGVRMNSFSDFMAHMFFDYAQAFADLSAKGLPMHSYTKELDFARLFGLTGGKINMSAIAAIRKNAANIDKIKGNAAKEAATDFEKSIAGLDISRLAEKLGKDESAITYDDVIANLDDVDYVWADESIDVKKATLLQTGILYDKLSDAQADYCYELIRNGQIDEAFRVAGEDNVNRGYAKHLGIITVGVSRAHILKLLRDPTIRMVIPYHKSGLNPAVAKAMNIAFYDDFTKVQNTSVKKGEKQNGISSDSAKVKGKNLADFRFYDYFGKTIDGVLYDGKATVAKYIEWCENGVYDEAVGDYVYYFTNGDYILASELHAKGFEVVPKFSEFKGEENYYKLVEDFDCYDTITGEHSAQEAVDLFHDGLPSDYKDVLVTALKAEQKVSDDFKDHLDNKGLRDEIMAIVGKNGYKPQVKKTSDRYSYEALASKPDMKLVTVGGNVPSSRADVVAEAKKNAAKVGKFNPKDGSVSVHVDDIDADVLLGTDGLKHGLRRNKNPQNEANYIVTLKAGEILRNSVQINELIPAKANATSSYVLIGAAKDGGGDLYIVRSLVNQFSNELTSMDVLYAINAKKESAVLNAPRSTAKPLSVTDSSISIAQLLDFVNRYFPDILPESVLRHFGYDARPDGDLGKNVLYQKKRDPSSYAPTFYSQMGKVVDGIKMDKIGTASVINFLKGKGIRHDEIKWSGIEAFLEGKKSVTKEELQQFVAASQLQIEEDVLDNKARPYTEDQKKRLGEYQAKQDEVTKRVADEWKKITGKDLPISIRNVATESGVVNAIIDANKEHKDASFEGRLLKKLEKDLREVIDNNDYFGFDSVDGALLSIHRHRRDFIKNIDASTNDKAVIVKYCNALNAYNELSNMISDEDADRLRAIAREGEQYSRKIAEVMREHDKEQEKHMPKWDQYTIKGGKNYREILFKMPDSTYSNDAMYTHWKERSGVLAHARVQDFDVNGKKMLFIEEIQSDWHNEGHKEGYGDTKKATDLKLKALALDDKNKAERRSLKEILAKHLEGKVDTPEAAALNILDFASNDRNNSIYVHFIRKYDIPIDLVSRINKLRKARDEAISLHSEAAELERGIPDAPFSDTYHEYVMKRLLRMAAEEGYDIIGWTPSEIQIERWSKEFEKAYRIEYDQEIPKFLRKYGKKWGAAVGETQLPSLNSKTTVFDVNRQEGYDTFSEWRDVVYGEYKAQGMPLEKLRDVRFENSGGFWIAYDATTGKEYDKAEIRKTSDSVWSMPITESMQQSVLYEGQPMFQKKKLSNRTILANALESAIDTSTQEGQRELAKLKEYQGIVGKIEELEAQRAELSAKAHEIRFKKGRTPDETKRMKAIQFEANQTANRINTYDRQLLKLEAMSPVKSVLHREKEMVRKRTEQKGREKLDAYREKAAETVRKLLTHVRETREKGVDSRRRTELRHKIKDIVQDLDTMLRKQTRERHVPEDLKAAVADVLSAINMDTFGADKRLGELYEKLQKVSDPYEQQRLLQSYGWTKQRGDSIKAKLVALKEAYNNIKKAADPELQRAFDAEVSDMIESVKDSVKDTPLIFMSLEQLNGVYKMFSIVRATIRDVNKSRSKRRKDGIEAWASKVMEEVDNLPKKAKPLPKKKNGKERFSIRGLLRKLNWNNLKPTYAMQRIGSKAFAELHEDVRDGEDTWARDVLEARLFYIETCKKHGYNSWDLTESFTFKSITGKEFEVSMDMIMSLYAYSKRGKQAIEHITGGGIVLDDGTGIADTYQITEATLAEIIGKLKPEMVAFADDMQAYLSDVMGAKGNEVSMELYDIKLFTEKFYFPLKSSKTYMEKSREQDQSKGDVKIKNFGFTKVVSEGSKNPIVLSSFVEVWATHVNEMSMYHAFVIPLEDFYRVYNYHTPYAKETEGVRGYIQTAHGEAAVAYIDQLLKDLNGGAVSDPRENWAKGLMTKFKKAATMLSLSTVIQQPTSIVRAMALIDAKYFVGKPTKRKHSETWEEVKKYAPVAVIKEMGYFDTNMGRSATDFITGQEYDGFKAKFAAFFKDSSYRDEIFSKAPALADELAWCGIWQAVKRETMHNHKDLSPTSEEFLKLCGERFTEVVTKTQVYDSVLSRSGNMRSKSVFMNMVTAFMGEPTTSLNMVQDGILKIQRGDKKGGAKAIRSVIGAVILNAALVSLVYAMRDDDEDETYTEKYVSRFATELIDGLNPLTYIPFVKDVWSIAQGFDVERTDMSLLSDLVDSLQGVIRVSSKDTDGMSEEQLEEHEKSVLDAWLSVVDTVGNLAGLPFKNIRREVESYINFGKTIGKDTAERDTTFGSLMDKLWEEVKNTVPVLGWFPDESKSDKLYDAIIDGDTEYVNRLKGGYKSESSFESAIRKALRENDPRIKEAAQAQVNGDFAEYDRIANEILGEGHFSKEDIKAAIKAEVNNMTPEEEKTEETEDKEISFYEMEHFYSTAMQGNMAYAEAIREDIIRTAVANGKTREDAEKSFNSSFQSRVRDRYEGGELSDSEAIRMLVNYGGKTEEEASTKVQYWGFKLDNPDTYVSEYWIDAYNEDVANSGVSLEMFIEYKNAVKDIEGEGAKARKMAVIHSLPISNAQKDALYYAEGWAASKLWESPWR